MSMIFKKTIAMCALAAIVLSVGCTATKESTVEQTQLAQSDDGLEPSAIVNMPAISSNDSTDMQSRLERPLEPDVEANQDAETIDIQEPPVHAKGNAADRDSTTQDSTIQPTDVANSPPKAASADTIAADQPSIPNSQDTHIAPPTYDSIIEQAELQITELRASIQRSLLDLYQSYLDETDAQTKQALITQAKAQIEKCDVEFESLMTTLKSSLTNNSYPTSRIAEYRSLYEEQKSLALALLE